jgi:hypothetical protein
MQPELIQRGVAREVHFAGLGQNQRLSSANASEARHPLLNFGSRYADRLDTSKNLRERRPELIYCGSCVMFSKWHRSTLTTPPEHRDQLDALTIRISRT